MQHFHRNTITYCAQTSAKKWWTNFLSSTTAQDVRAAQRTALAGGIVLLVVESLGDISTGQPLLRIASRFAVYAALLVTVEYVTEPKSTATASTAVATLATASELLIFRNGGDSVANQLLQMVPAAFLLAATALGLHLEQRHHQTRYREKLARRARRHRPSRR